jgi:hypothetical protein
MSANDRINLLEHNINGSKRYEFVEDDVERISGYYIANSININFTKLIEILRDYDIEDYDIEELLLTDEEQEGEY